MVRIAFFSTIRVRPAVLPEMSTAKVIVHSLKGLTDSFSSGTGVSFSFLILAGGVSWPESIETRLREEDISSRFKGVGQESDVKLCWMLVFYDL